MPNEVNFCNKLNMGAGGTVSVIMLSENLSRLHQHNSHYPNSE